MQVYALVDRDGTRANITAVTLLSGLNTPNGVAYQDGSLRVAQVLNITRYDDVDAAALAGQVRCSSAALQVQMVVGVLLVPCICALQTVCHRLACMACISPSLSKEKAVAHLHV